jgi:hypothetical protein
MSYDYKAKKIVAVLASDLEAGVALNVIGHLAISIGAYGEELMGRPKLPDASGILHLGIAKYPLIITKLKSSKLKALIEQVKKLGTILIAEYPEQVLHTRDDDELATAIANADHEDMKYLGAILYGDSDLIDSLTGKFTLWR